MGVIIIIVGIILIIAQKTRGRKIGLPGMGSPIGNVSVMKVESSLGGKVSTYKCL